MVDIPKSRRTVGFDSGTGVRTVAPVPVDTGLEEAFGAFGKTIEDIARRQEREEDINTLSTKETEYKRRLIPILQAERDFQGGATKGNIERVSTQSQEIRKELFGDVPDRLLNDLNATYDSIDVGNDLTLSRLRSAGIVVEREQKRADAVDVAGSNVVDNPFNLFNELTSLAEMIQNEIDSGVTTKEEGKELLQTYADDLFEKASAGIFESSGAKAQLAFLESGSFDEFISADLEEKIKGQIPKLRKAVKDEEKRKVDEVETIARRLQVEAKDKLDAKWKLDIDEETNISIPEIWASEVHTNTEKAEWQIKSENASKGKTVKTDIDTYENLSTEFDGFTDDSSEDEINKTWAKVQEAYRQGNITRVDYDHFQSRRDAALKKSDPLNSDDFKVGKSIMIEFGNNGGFIPKDENGNVILKKNATPDQILTGRQRQTTFIKKFEKWKQDNPKEDSQKWIDEQFEPVQKEMNKGAAKAIIEFMFGSREDIEKLREGF